VFEHFSLADVLISYVALLFSLSVHEASHATVAYWLHDDTAARLGRMTLNPIAHLHPIGTFLFPLLGMITGFPFIGWAKPVPVNPSNFSRRWTIRKGIGMVSAAGPLSNILLSLIFFLVTVIAVRMMNPQEVSRAGLFIRALQGVNELTQVGNGPGMLLLALSGQLVMINILLAMFNFLPVGPLDGGGILQAFLSYRAAQTFEKYKPHMFIGLILAVMIPVTSSGASLLGLVLGPVINVIFISIARFGLFLIGA
jgi:Zn-dependent protease